MTAAVALAAMVLQVPSVAVPKNAHAEETPPAAGTEAQASALAKKTGKPVPVPSQQTETSDVVANSDGTFTLTQHLRPIRTRKNGAWVKIDTTLKRRPGGAIEPAASAVGLKFSGDGPTVTMTHAGRELSLSWPAKLPEPRLNGNEATFSEVIPGVDLILRADVEGFAHLLKIKNPEAAKNPRLAQLRFKLKTTGLSVKADAFGYLKASDTGAGGTVFEAPTPMMWDSAVPADDAEARAASPDAVAQDPVEGPPQGAKTAPVKVDVAGGEFILRPDQRLLAAPDTRFPVFVDPVWETKKASAWAMVSSAFPTTSYYKFSGTEGVGYCDVSLDGTCVRTGRKRIFFRMPLSGVSGKYVESVEFVAYETHAYNCSNDTSVQLWHASAFGSGSTWNTTTDNWKQHLTSREVSYCSHAPVEFGGTNLASVVRSAASRRDSTITFGLKAYDETSMAWWKRFADDAYLKVLYNNPPRQPDTDTMYSSPGTPCVNTPDAKWVNNEPRLFATLSDPDTEDKNKVRGQFSVEWTDDAGVKKNWTSALTAAKASGSRFDVQIPPGAIPQRRILNWQARASDGTQWSPWSWAGAQTACYFYFDETVPQPPGVVSASYPADDAWHDGVGTPGNFTVDDPGNSAARYEIRLNDQPLISKDTTNGAPVTVALAPTRSGPNYLTVQSVNNAGTFSAASTYEFLANVGTSPRAHWKLDESAGVNTTDGRDAQDVPAVLHGSATLGAAGIDGTALSLTTWGDYAATSGPVVRTDKSFSVSAWVKLDDKSLTRAVVSQDGTYAPGFVLLYSSVQDKWTFSRWTAADSSGSSQSAVSARVATVGEWTHLVGVYDAASRQGQIFVNGEPGSSFSYAGTDWSATGPFTIGRSMNQGTQGRHWDGQIDDVRVFEHQVSAAEAMSLYTRKPTEVRPASLAWSLDEAAQSSEVVGKAERFSAGLHGSATLGAAGIDGTALSLTTWGDYAATSGPVVRTDKSFSVSAWVKLDDKSLTRAVVSQDGTYAPGFVLLYSSVQDKWTFSRWTAADSSGSSQSAVSARVATVGEWTHLVGVYDAASRQGQIFVNGEPGSSFSYAGTDWSATGPFTIGRSMNQGHRADTGTARSTTSASLTGSSTPRRPKSSTTSGRC
ncbi:LamG-like jellyroll fold domain-containing protein [Actinomadura sp. HBU206391]|uniref:LamG-like jellyroll fold domain-containing protein n=1 Tax=Actinomadura sp. HBU206391 TaxID=2731692 RepID=UPI00164F32C9|nr:LamG-like jellyroll fold domain-containing protein [Actinomadura sp. HBU206391]MBC6460897.1 LamG domain-containing protein [Actinomadura sp. HBU206391]